MEETILNTLTSVDKAFTSNELAYLALTSKIEMPLRDKWAFSLYRALSNRGLIVSREWKRADLAILEGAHPKALIELTAMYTFNALGKCGFVDKMKADQEKARKLAGHDTFIYTVLLATHPLREVDDKYEGVIKYGTGINRALRKHGNANQVEKVAKNAVLSRLSGKNIVLDITFVGGSAFEVETNVMCWVVKA